MSNVREFGAKGDGRSDDTQAVQHAIERGDGLVEFPRGEYRLTRPLVVPLHLHGRLALTGRGGTARLIMQSSGPALHLIGTHRRTAQPDEFQDVVWLKERMPTLTSLEIVGDHPDADGIRLEGTMQVTVTGVLIRRCRHGIHLVQRNRNVLISHCHIYDNRGVGIYLDAVNLHQMIVVGSHISYCKQGGVRVAGGEVRNLQITGNDIEYNHDPQADASADVCFDAREGTIREGTIVGNTIQARMSPQGANVRLLGVGADQRTAVGMLTITGNLLGSQQTVVHLDACRGVVVNGNAIYSGYHYAILAERCEHLVLSGNSIDHNSDYRGPSTDAVVLRHCRNVQFSDTILQHTLEAALPVEASLTVEQCENVNLIGCQFIHPRNRAVDIRNSQGVRVAHCFVRSKAQDAGYRLAVRVRDSQRIHIHGNFLDAGSEGMVDLPPGAGTSEGNL